MSKQQTITKEEFFPNFQGSHMSDSQWQCPLGHWNTALEKCVHIKDGERLVDFRKESL